MSEVNWRAAYTALAADYKEVCGIVFVYLTDPEKDMSADERIAFAANEIQQAFLRAEAREIFDAAGMGEGEPDDR